MGKEIGDYLKNNDIYGKIKNIDNPIPRRLLQSNSKVGHYSNKVLPQIITQKLYFI